MCLVGLELVFFTVACMVLFFIFLIKNNGDITSVFYLMLNSACTVSRLSLFLTLPPPRVQIQGGQEVERGQSQDG